ncbi:MAG: adenosylmethionine decarboxylase, partial [Bacteroidota bacterium]
ACRAAGATVLGAQFHQFQPEGVTGIVLLSESHASVHTWPEAGLVTLDVFTCGALDAAAIVDAIRQRVSPVRERVTAVARGDAQPAARSSRTATGTPGEPLPDHRRGEGGIRADAAPAGASGPAAGTEPAPASYTLYPDPD